jgi:hypothetical protein
LENHQYAKTAPKTTTTTITANAIFSQDFLGFGTTSDGLGAASEEGVPVVLKLKIPHLILFLIITKKGLWFIKINEIVCVLT